MTGKNCPVFLCPLDGLCTLLAGAGGFGTCPCPSGIAASCRAHDWHLLLAQAALPSFCIVYECSQHLPGSALGFLGSTAQLTLLSQSSGLGASPFPYHYLLRALEWQNWGDKHLPVPLCPLTEVNGSLRVVAAR